MTRRLPRKRRFGHRQHRRNTAPLYNGRMYIIVIGWLYVTVLMALTENSVVAGILTLTFYGLLPSALLLWLFGGPMRRRRRATRLAGESGGKESGADDEPPDH